VALTVPGIGKVQPGDAIDVKDNFNNSNFKEIAGEKKPAKKSKIKVKKNKKKK
jgi:hypothetical protein